MSPQIPVQARAVADIRVPFGDANRAQRHAHGPGRVTAIDRLPERLALARDKGGAETIDFTDPKSTLEQLRE